MDFLALGFFTGLSLILAFGAQNIFVMEQGLKKQFVFTVCLICSISDLLLIFLGIFLFESFKVYFNDLIAIILNILLFVFLVYFIFSKIKTDYSNYNLDISISDISFKSIIIKTLGFTYLNPHVYSDTVFFLGNFSKNFELNDKILFGTGASISSLIFFFTLGYSSKLLSKYLMEVKIRKVINLIIILFMSSLAIYVLGEIFKFPI